MRGQRRERRVAVDARQVRAGAADLIDPRIARGAFVGPAAAARTKPRLARLVGALEELDAVAARPPARTRRAAIHAGRSHRVDKRPVRRAIARHHRIPFGCGSHVAIMGSGTHARYPVLAIELYRPQAAGADPRLRPGP